MDRALDYNDIKMAKDILNKNNDAFEEFMERIIGCLVQYINPAHQAFTAY